MPYDPFEQGAQLPAQEFTRFLNGGANVDPRLLSAGLNAGLALMQPPAWGDTFASQLARAIGTGAEASQRSTEQQTQQRVKEAQAESSTVRANAAQARAEAAQARAGAAGERAGYQAERLQLAREANAGLNERSRLSALIRAQNQWSNERLLNPDLDFPTFLQQRGLAHLLTPIAGAPNAPQSDTTTTPQGDVEALTAARAAIARGADPAAVRQRLIENGIDPGGL